MTTEAVNLNEYDKDEWHDIVRTIKPDLSQEEFDEMWEEFVQMKARKQVN